MKVKPLLLMVTLVGLALVETAVFAQVPRQDVQLVANELKIFPVQQLKRVAVGDPGIADVSVLNERELMLIAKKAGVTSLIVWDEQGQRTFKVTVKEKDLEKIAQRIRELLVSSEIEGVNVKVDGENIYLTGEVLTERELTKVKEAMAPFNNAVSLVNIRERQPLVEIDVNVFEVAVGDLKKLGLDWSSSLPIQYTETATNRQDKKIADIWRVLRWNRSALDAKLNFLIEEDKARTLANPKILTLSGKEASFLVGGEVPYVTVETEGRTQVEWKEYGITLKIEPLVNSKNEIHTKIKAEVTDLDWGNAVTQQGYNIPALKSRQAETELFLNEEDTVILAGLIKNDDSRDIERLPWLSKVPILGTLFKSTDFRNKRTELVISLTPRIIGAKASTDYVSSELIKQEAIVAAQRSYSVYGEEDSPLTYYSHMIEDIISAGVVYPASAKADRQEGIVKIDLYLLSDGQLKDVQVKESSGYQLLDRAAVASVQDLAPYPSFPPEVIQKELRITVPVVFKSYVRNE